MSQQSCKMKTLKLNNSANKYYKAIIPDDRKPAPCHSHIIHSGRNIRFFCWQDFYFFKRRRYIYINSSKISAKALWCDAALLSLARFINWWYQQCQQSISHPYHKMIYAKSYNLTQKLITMDTESRVASTIGPVWFSYGPGSLRRSILARFTYNHRA